MNMDILLSLYCRMTFEAPPEPFIQLEQTTRFDHMLCFTKPPEPVFA